MKLLLLLLPALAAAETPATPVAQALLAETLAQPEVQQAIEEASDPRQARRLGIDLRVGNPGGAFGPGAGLELRYTIVAPVTVGAGVDSNLASVTVSAEATVNILPIFIRSKWTPIVSVGFSHLRFTGMSDKINKDIASGTYMSSLFVTGGVDYVGRSGFHFKLSAGRSAQLGRSGGTGPEEGLVLEGWTSWVGMASVGKMW